MQKHTHTVVDLDTHTHTHRFWKREKIHTESQQEINPHTNRETDTRMSHTHSQIRQHKEPGSTSHSQLYRLPQWKTELEVTIDFIKPN